MPSRDPANHPLVPLSRILSASLASVPGAHPSNKETAGVRGRPFSIEAGWQAAALRGFDLLASGEEGNAATLFRLLAVRGESDRARATGLRGLGEIALRRGRVTDALFALRRAIDADGSDLRSRVLLAVAFGLLPDDESCLREWSALEEGARGEGVGAEALLGLAAGHPAFDRRLKRDPDLRRRIERAAPTFFGAGRLPEDRRGAALRPIRLERAANELARLAATTRSGRRWLGLALPRIARAAGFPRVSLRRQTLGDETIVRSWGDVRGPRAAPRAREVVEVADLPGTALVLESPHAWSVGEEERRLLERAAGLLAERLRLPGMENPQARDWAGMRIRLGARSVGLFEREAGREAVRLLARGGAAEVAVPDPDDPLVAAALGGETVLDRRVLAVPVGYEGRVIGALVLRSRRRDLGPREVRRAHAFAVGLGVRRLRARFREFARRRWRLDLRLPVVDDVDTPPLRSLLRAARSGAPILLHGETGTGKETLARFAHFESARRERPLVVFDAASIPDSVAEADLFGVAAGAYTGARSRPGFLESAHEGTILLEGIDEISPRLQAKLLRALEARAIRRIGDESPHPADVRVVATMRRDPSGEVRAGRLRLDLFHRIGAVVLRVPPLRERRPEIPVLARALLGRLGARSGTEPPALEPDATALLWRQPWQGNVRELENLLCKALALRPEGALDAAALRAAASRFGLALLEAIPTRGPRSREELAVALRTALGERRARIGRAAELLGWHPGTVSRKAVEVAPSIRDR